MGRYYFLHATSDSPSIIQMDEFPIDADFPESVEISERYGQTDSVGVLWWDKIINNNGELIGLSLYKDEMDSDVESKLLFSAINVKYDLDRNVYKVYFTENRAGERDVITTNMSSRLYRNENGLGLLIADFD